MRLRHFVLTFSVHSCCSEDLQHGRRPRAAAPAPPPPPPKTTSTLWIYSTGHKFTLERKQSEVAFTNTEHSLCLWLELRGHTHTHTHTHTHIHTHTHTHTLLCEALSHLCVCLCVRHTSAQRCGNLKMCCSQSQKLSERFWQSGMDLLHL